MTFVPLSHTDAQRIVASTGVTPGESMFTRAVSWHETNYGNAEKFAGTYNMGAIIDTSGGGILHGDSRPNPDDPDHPIQYTTHFAVYPDAPTGFLALEHTLLKPNVKSALAAGSYDAAVRAQYSNGYFTGTSLDPETNIQRYLDAVLRARDTIMASTGEKDPLDFNAPVARPTPLPSQLSPSGARLLSFALLEGARPVLRFGHVGPDVAFMQFALGVARVTGSFDVATEARVRTFQHARGLNVDGVVGTRETWPAIERMLKAGNDG